MPAPRARRRRNLRRPPRPPRPAQPSGWAPRSSISARRRPGSPPLFPPPGGPGWGPPPLLAGADPILTEFHDLLAETAEAAAAVLSAWRPGAPAAVLRPLAPAAPVGPRSKTTHRVMSLRTDPYLADHCLLQAPPGGGSPGDRFPIVPMTGAIDLIVAAAAELVGERRVIGVRGVRALRPLAVEPEVTLIIEATEKPGDGQLSVVTVTVDGRVGSGPRESYARATVLLADDYPVPPALREYPLTAERPSEVDAVGLYADRWMFHGPAYRGVAELGTVADDGVRGVLEVLPTPGALLDAAGQLLGFWIALQPANRLVLPATVGSVSFYGPDPEPGTRLPTVVHVRSASDDEAVADLELRDAVGAPVVPHHGLDGPAPRDRRRDRDRVPPPGPLAAGPPAGRRLGAAHRAVGRPRRPRAVHAPVPVAPPSGTSTAHATRGPPGSGCWGASPQRTPCGRTCGRPAPARSSRRRW